MSADLNHLTLSGRLARDPVLATLPSGHVVCDMVLASHHRSRDDHTGAWREFTDYIPVRSFGFHARAAFDQLYKGSQVSLVGRICSRKASGDGGEDRWVVEMVAQAVLFAERPR